MFDEEGKGHHGKEAIAKFYDMAIAPSELTFNFDEDLPVRRRGSQRRQHRHHGRAGTRSSPKGCSPTGSNDEGKIVALRAYWELDARHRRAPARSSPDSRNARARPT